MRSWKDAAGRKARRRLLWLTTAFWVTSIVLAHSARGAGSHAGPNIPSVVSPGARRSQPPAPPRIPRGDWEARTLAGIHRLEYQFNAAGEDRLAAPNRARNLRSSFSSLGLTLSSRIATDPRSEPALLELRLARYGRGENLLSIPPAAPVARGNRVEYARGDLHLREWYVNDEKGLEQGFTLETAPARDAGGPVVLEMEFSAELTARIEADGRSARFVDPRGRVRFKYANLSVRDALNRPITARLSAGTGRLSILIEDRDAAYPIEVDPLLTNADWSTKGNAANTQLGFSVAMGDVNGDGFSDAVVGAYLFDGGNTDEGKVFVYHGSASGLPGAASWTAEANQDGAQFGYSVAVARLGSDPFADLIIGAPSYDTVFPDNRGRVFVWYGSNTGLGANGFPGNQDWFADNGQSNSQFGFSVAGAGDVNGNGVPDLIVGCPQFSNGQANEGRALVYHAVAAGLPLPATPSWTAESDLPQAKLGYAVASAGNAGADPAADVVIGAPFFGPFLGDNRGKAFVWYGAAGPGLGPPNGLPGNADWSADSAQPGARFGSAVASAGDVDGNGRDEVLVGAPFQEDFPAQFDEGWAYLYYGGFALSPVPNWSAQGNDPNAQLGTAVAKAGDADADGFGDILVGAPFYDNVAGDNRGRVFFWQGSVAGLGGSGTPQNADWAAESDLPNARFGIALASGDVNADGRSDVLIGADATSNPSPLEGAAFLYLGFAPPVFLEFGPQGDSRRIEATGASYTAIVGLVDGQYGLAGGASVKMGNCTPAAACTRSFAFTGLLAEIDPADLSSTGQPAFRVVGGCATVDASLSPIQFPDPTDLNLKLHSLMLDAAGGTTGICAGGVVAGPRSGLWLTLPSSLTSRDGTDLDLPDPIALEQDLGFATTVTPDSEFWIGPKDYPYIVKPQLATSYSIDRTRGDLGLSTLEYLPKEQGDPGSNRCAVTGACLDHANDRTFSLAWELDHFPEGGAPPGSVANPSVEKTGLRATLYLPANAPAFPLLFPAGVDLTLFADSSIEITGSEPSGGALRGSLLLSLHTGAVYREDSGVLADCQGEYDFGGTFSGGQILSGGQLRIPSLALPPLSNGDFSWAGSGDPSDNTRGFSVSGLDSDSLLFYAPGTVARMTPERASVAAHLLAERDDGSGRGTYAGVNIDESATAGLDVECPCPPLGGHSLSAASTETRLYARRAGVSGIADSGGVGSLPFAYMGYELTLSRFGNTFLDNQVRQSGVQADRLVIPAPSDVAFDFATDSRVTMLSCADLGDLGEIESPGAGKTLQYWNADFRPYVVGFQDPGPDCPDNPDCPAVIPASCACAEECDVRYVHVDSQAPLELEAGAPAVKRYAEDVPLDFAPAPEGHLVCSDIVPAGSSGSVRNEFEPDYGFSADLTELELLPRNPAAPEDGDAGSRYEVEGETLFPFYGGTASCAVVRSGDVDFRGQCDAPASKVHVSRAILAGLIDLDFHLSYFDPIRAADDDARETGARFLAESASFNLQFFRVPASVKLFGNRPAVGGLPELPERPEVYMGFLSDMAAFAEARGTQDVPCTSGTSCYERLTDLLDLPEGPGGIDDLVPSLRARAAELGDDLRSMAADAMADTVGDVLPADILRIAGRVKGTVDGLRDGAAGSDFFNLENLTGPGTFENITNVEEVQDIVLSRLRLDADIDVTDFFSFKGFAELNRHTANTVDDTDDSADVTIGAHDVDLGWLLDMGRARTIQATFRFDTSPFDVWGFDGRVDLAGLEFGEVTFDTIDLLLGMGNPPTGPEYYYVAGSARGHYKAITAEGGFFFGRSPDIEPILAIDPDVGEMLEGIDSLSGIYLRAEASFPILGGPECAPLRLVGGGGNAYWLFTDGPTFGAKMHAYAHGSLACLVHARGDATLLGGLTDGTWRLAGSGFFAGGVGSCEPEDWRSRRSVLADDWCLACVLDGEFETDSESSKLRGDYHGPTCR